MNIFWLRGKPYISYNRPHTWFVLGRRGSGKSSFLEYQGQNYLDAGHHVFDLFGSRDGEGLAWLRNPEVSHNEILLIHSDSVEITKAPCETRPMGKLELDDFDNYRVLISSSPLYLSPDDEFRQVNRVTELIYKRLSYRKLVYVLVREAANLYYSRLKVANNQTQAKAEMTYLVREARHMGMAMGLDTLKFTSIDIDIRAVIDYLIFKAQGILGVPRDLWWMFNTLDPAEMRRYRPGEFAILTSSGCLGLGEFSEIPWHKREKEHILNQVGVFVEYGEAIDYGKNRGTYETLGDPEHAALIMDYLEIGVGMGKIGEAHSISAGTVHNHIKKHNKAVVQDGECPMCRRVDGSYYQTRATRGYAKKS